MFDLQELWPSTKEVEQCIPIQAERLSDGTFRAVHEPMQLEWKSSTGSQSSPIRDESVLERMLQNSNGPIPIIGESGSGKSHFIRWLDSELKAPKFKKRYHVVRIPKNASLRSSLEVIIRDLEGQSFESIRKQLPSVAESESESRIAERLLQEMSFWLRDEYEKVEFVRMNQEAKASLDANKKTELREIGLHCAPNKLPALVTDNEYKKILLEPGSTIIQYARRIAGGDSREGIDQEEIDSFTDGFTADDLIVTGKGVAVDNLSVGVRDYFTFLSEEEERQKASDMLTKAVNESTKRYANYWFKNLSVSFQDLFVAIRETLFSLDKDLVLLVEDLAAISSIDKALIDCLLEDPIEGKTCKVHSAIATTSGYFGYRSIRDTLVTRANGEVFIDIHFDGQRITSFIDQAIELTGRYLNAARIGRDDLDALFLNGDPVTSSHSLPDEWSVSELVSNAGYSLFPLSRTAVKNLVNEYILKGEGRRFSPREVINNVILRTVSRNLPPWSNTGPYPSADAFDGMMIPTAISENLRSKGFDSADTGALFLQIYGDENQPLGKKIAKIPTVLRDALGWNGLIEYGELQSEVVTPEPGVGKGTGTGTGTGTAGVDGIRQKIQQEIQAIDRLVSEWVERKKSLSQRDETAPLKELFLGLVKNRVEKIGIPWELGNKKRALIPTTNLSIPNSAVSPASGMAIPFFKDEQLDTDKAYVSKVVGAMLRHIRLATNDKIKSCDQDTFNLLSLDILTIDEFVSDWLDTYLGVLIDDRFERIESGFSDLFLIASECGLVDLKQGSSLEHARAVMTFGRWYRANSLKLTEGKLLPPFGNVSSKIPKFYESKWVDLEGGARTSFCAEVSFYNYDKLAKVAERDHSLALERATAMQSHLAEYLHKMSDILSQIEGIETADQFSNEINEAKALLSLLTTGPLAGSFVDAGIDLARLNDRLARFGKESQWFDIVAFLNRSDYQRAKGKPISIQRALFIDVDVLEELADFCRDWGILDSYLKNLSADGLEDSDKTNEWDHSLQSLGEKLKEVGEVVEQ